MFGVMQHLDITICDSPDDATAKGFVYHGAEKAVEIQKVVVVKNATKGGNSTVDLILVDEKGNKYVVMITGNLLKSIPC